jgi:3-oxoacyl-(acyl-carrier-protein) synthase
MSHRVVVTGLGVIAPNGTGLADFKKGLDEGRSGIRFIPRMEQLNFSCRVGGEPQNYQSLLPDYFSAESLLAMNQPMIFSGMAAIDTWKDAGFKVPDSGDDSVDWDTGAIVGIGLAGVDTLPGVIAKIDSGKTRRLGSTVVEQIMSSSVSAKVSGLLALGNQVTTNSSACSTGTEAIYFAYERVRMGLAKRMLAGGIEGSSEYVWAGFDGMKVLNTGSNDHPEKASRPMSQSAGGFIPGSGAGMLMLETLESALERGARIYAEIVGGAVNSGGHRMGGSMTLPNATGVQKCIRQALGMAGITGKDIDAVNGHLTATMADPMEIKNWATALERIPDNFPKIASTKSMIGHCLGAAGGIEGVASVLQVHHQFVHPSLNCEDVHEYIKPYEKSIAKERTEMDIKYLAKASFGFGDVNSAIIYKRWEGK